MNIEQLIIDGKTDAEIASLSADPVYAPRTAPVTFATIANVWGASRAAEFKAGLKSVAGGIAGAQMAAMADFALGLLDGPGFDASHPDAVSTAGAFAAAGLCTELEAKRALNIESASGWQCSAEEVAAVRARMEREADIAADDAEVTAAWNQWSHDRDEWIRDGGERPAKPF